jgi:peptidoglycan/xylan/chitin deacetylase (PgdA/CDA1 family)
VIDQFLEAGTDFHLHSYSHDLARPDAQEEIERGQAAFTSRFGRPAVGYRAPEGRISPEGLARLEAAGFLFDSSLFPSLWPHPRYFTKPRAPHVPAGRSILEIPVSTLGPAHVIVSLSWMKLLGWGAYRRLLNGPLPDPLVFDTAVELALRAERVGRARHPRRLPLASPREGRGLHDHDGPRRGPRRAEARRVTGRRG